MASVELLERDRIQDAINDGPENRLAQELESIVEDAEQAQDVEQPKARHWYYSVPFAGVRYYSF